MLSSAPRAGRWPLALTLLGLAALAACADEPVAPATPAYTDITDQARYTLDSGGRRLKIELPSSLQREAAASPRPGRVTPTTVSLCRSRTFGPSLPKEMFSHRSVWD